MSFRSLQFSNNILNKHIRSIDVSDDNTVVFEKYNSGNTQNIDVTKGLPQLTYDSTNERVVSSTAIETTLNSFFLRDQHRITSGAENIFFTNQGSNIDFFPCWQGLKDQSIVENQDSTGILLPTARTYSDNVIPLERFANPIESSSTPFNTVSTSEISSSVYGMEFIYSEDIDPSLFLQFTVTIDDREIYTQRFKDETHIKGDRATIWFSHPLETHIGTTAKFVITKHNATSGDIIDFLQVERAENLDEFGNIKPYVKMYLRLFEDKRICFKDELTARYLGVWDASGNIPDLSTLSPNNYDFFYVRVPGTYNDVEYNLNDKIVYNSTTEDWERLEYPLATIETLENSALDEYDLVVDSEYTGDVSTGSNLRPYKTIHEAIDNSTSKNKILLKNEIVISNKITLPHSLYFYGAKGTKVKYSTYVDTNEDIFFHDGDNTSEFGFYDIIFENSGGFAINISKTLNVEIEKCKIQFCGWNGQNLNTQVPSTLSTLLGYDSNQTDLQNFYASSVVSDGGAISLTESTMVRIIGNTISVNFRGIRVQDCGKNGAGFITRNVVSSNIESGIYLAAGLTHNGCENITVTINATLYNASNGILSVCGKNNKFSQNEVKNNWNCGICLFSPSNITVRDCGYYNNVMCDFNGIGNLADGKATVQINGDYTDENNNILTFSPDYSFLTEILDSQIHFTGSSGSASNNIGIFISSEIGDLTFAHNNIIKIDDIRFTGEEYAIDLSEVDLSNIHLTLGDNSYQSISEKTIKPPLNGMYFELPFSEHVMSVKELDIVTNTINKTIILKDGVNGNVINLYKINELMSVQNTNSIDIIQKNSNKIQLKGLTLGNVYINGVVAGSNLSSMNDTINSTFTMDLVQFKTFLETTVNITKPTKATFYFIESPDNFWHYPLFKTQQEAIDFDTSEGGSGTFKTKTFIDDLSNTTFYIPDTSYVSNGNSKPIHGTYSNTLSVVWNEILSGPDSDYFFETTLGDSTYTLFYIEDSSGIFHYPLFKNGADAADLDARMDGPGNANIKIFTDDYSGVTWYAPQNHYVNNGTSAPVNGDWTYNPHLNLSFSNFFWNKHEFTQESEIGTNTTSNAVFFYIESPDGNFEYPLFRTPEEANAVDLNEGGTGTSSTTTFIDDLSGTTWYVPSTNYTSNGTSAPVDGPWNNTPNVIWHMQPTDDDNNYEFPTDLGNGNEVTFYYIESPDGTFTYPLFKTPLEANNFDVYNGGSGNSSPATFLDDPSGLQYWIPFTLAGSSSSAPVNGTFGNTSNVIWYERPTNADSLYVPTFTDIVVTVQEGSAINLQYKPAGDTNTYVLTNGPTYLVDNGYSIQGTAEDITDGNDVQYVINVTKANQFGSTTGTITINITNIVTNDDDQTPWMKMVTFDGDLDHLKPHTGSDVFSILRRENSTGSTTVTPGKTATDGHPWAITFVLKRLGDHSLEKGILSFRNGTGSGKEGIRIMFKGNKFNFRYGNGYNNLEFQGDVNYIPTNEWIGIYIEYNGGSTGVASGSVNDYYSRFRFKAYKNGGNLPGSFDGVFEDIPGTWLHTNYGFNSTFSSKVLSVGSAHDIKKCFNGSIAAHVQTSLRCNVDLPTDDEIKILINDPIKWVNTYKEGQPYRKTGQTADHTILFDKTTYDSNIATRLYLMGDVNPDNAGWFIYPRIPNWFDDQLRLVLTNMTAGDIVNIV